MQEVIGSNPIFSTTTTTRLLPGFFMAWLYILYSASRDRYYIGATVDLERRLEQHNTGRSPSTKSGLPWELVFSQQFETAKLALAQERKLKSMKSRSFLIQYINSFG
jgi:putative endonuclease